MSDQEARWKDVLLAFAILVGVFLLVGGCTVFSQGIQRNDRQKVHRDQVVKIECLRHGYSFIPTDDGPACVRLAH